MQSSFRQQLKEFDDKSCLSLLKIYVISALFILILATVYVGFQLVDEFEHLHASWLISIGKVPYRDFLEHHHPLLWYLSAPLVELFYDNAIIFYVMRGVSFCGSLLTTFYIYRIVLFFGNKVSQWLAVSFFLGNLITLYTFYQFRPDNFMNLFFIMGIYYCFCYIKRLERKDLVWSFLCFAVAFLFLQKIFFLLSFVGLIISILLFSKKMRFSDVFIAILPALMLLAGFFFFIYHQGFFLEFFELNYPFNHTLVSYFNKGRFWYPHLFLSIYGFTLITAFYFYKKENMYFKIITLLYGYEFLLRAFYFSPHPHYYSLLAILSALILSVYARILMPKFKFIFIALIIGLFSHLGYLATRVFEANDSYQHYLLVDYIHKNSTQNDYLMNGYDNNFNIYRKDVSYYWFGLDMLVPLMEKEYGLQQQLDINNLIIAYRPKFLYVKNHLNLHAYRTYGETTYSQSFIPELIQALYKQTPFKNLVMLK